MNKFKIKIQKMKKKLSFWELKYGVNNIKPYYLRKKIELYEEVDKMSHQEVGDKLSYAAGEIEKLKSGYYYYETSVDDEKKLLNVLRERIKSDNKDAKDELKRINNTDLVELGCSAEDRMSGGIEIS